MAFGSQAAQLDDVQLARLIAAAASGDTTSFVQLYDLISRRVFGFAIKIVLDRGAAEDVAQMAYLEVWRRAAQFDPTRSAVIPWLLMITHARAVDRIRGTERARRHDHAAHARTGARVAFDSVTETAEQRHDEAAVRTALTSLSTAQRKAIELVYWHGMTGNEASTALHVPLGTFKSRVRDAHIILRGALAEAI